MPQPNPYPLRGSRAAAHNRNAVVKTIAAASVDGITAYKVGRLLGLTRQSVARILRPLVDDGTITRQPDPTDNRSVRYRFTRGA